MYANNIENTPFFLLLGVFFALHGVYVTFGSRYVKNPTKNHQTPAQHKYGSSTFTISFTEMFMYFEKQYYCFDLHKPFSCGKQQIANDCWNMFRLL